MAKKGDLLVTIKGDATSFDKTMSESTNQIRKMQQQSAKAEASFNKFGGQIQGLASGALMKFAGAVGAAYTAQEAFNKAIRASQTTSDEFDIVISQAKASVDFFFQSVSTGNWSNFFEGLEGALSRAKTLSIEMDYLGDLLAGWSDIEGEKRTKVQENLAKLYDPSTTKEEAEKLKAENKLLLADLEDAKNAVTKQLKKVTLDTFKKVGYRDDLTDDDLTWYLREASMHKDQEFEEYSEKRAAAVAADMNATQTYGTNWGGVTINTDANLKALQKENKELERKWQLNNAIADDDRNEIIALRNQERAMSSSIAAMSRTVSRSESRNFEGSGSSSNLPTVFADGSMAKAEQDLREAEKTLSELTQGTEAWYKALEKVNKLRVENDNYQNYLKDLELIKEIQDIQVMSIDELSFDQIQKNQRIITDLVGKISNKALREQFDDLLKYYSNSISEMQIRASAEMYINMMVTPTNYTTNKSDDKELKELTKELKELSRAIAIEKDPTKLSDLQSQYTSKTARMEELKAIHQRPSIFNSLNPDIRRTLGVEKDKTIDWTNPSSLQKYEDDIVDKTMLFQASYDKNHPLYQYIIDRLTAEQRIVATRNDDLIADLYNIDIKSLENQNKPKNREDLLKGRANLQRGVETTTEELDLQKHILDKLFKDFNNLSNDIEKLKTKRDLETDPDKKKEYNEQIKQLFEERDKIYKGVEQVGEDGEVTIIINGIEQQTEKIKELERHIQGILKVSDDLAGVYDLGQINIEEQMQKNVELTNQWRDALSNVGTMFYNIGAISDESTARTLSGLSSVFSGIQQMIPAIQTLTLLNQKDALAAAVKSGAALPFPANLAAIGASVAAVVAGFAQMASVPKFAEGGLVYGNTIAQVGEYANASSNPEVIAPLSKLKNILAESGGTNGNVRFEIEGKKLVGVLDNYSSIKRKR